MHSIDDIAAKIRSTVDEDRKQAMVRAGSVFKICSATIFEKLEEGRVQQPAVKVGEICGKMAMLLSGWRLLLKKDDDEQKTNRGDDDAAGDGDNYLEPRDPVEEAAETLTELCDAIDQVCSTRSSD